MAAVPGHRNDTGQKASRSLNWRPEMPKETVLATCQCTPCIRHVCGAGLLHSDELRECNIASPCLPVRLLEAQKQVVSCAHPPSLVLRDRDLTIGFRRSTKSPLYCDLSLLDARSVTRKQYGKQIRAASLRCRMSCVCDRAVHPVKA